MGRVLPGHPLHRIVGLELPFPPPVLRHDRRPLTEWQPPSQGKPEYYIVCPVLPPTLPPRRRIPDTEAIAFRCEKEELQGQPPPLVVDVYQPPFDIYTNALHYLGRCLDTDSTKWPMIHVLIFTSRSPTPSIDQIQRHQPRPRLGGCPIRIVEVESFIFRASVARDDNIPGLVFALEQGAAGVCRAVVVDLHRGLAHLLVGNPLLRALECWSAIYPPTPSPSLLLTSTVLSRKQAQIVPATLLLPRHASW